MADTKKVLGIGLWALCVGPTGNRIVLESGDVIPPGYRLCIDSPTPEELKAEQDRRAAKARKIKAIEDFRARENNIVPGVGLWAVYNSGDSRRILYSGDKVPAGFRISFVLPTQEEIDVARERRAEKAQRSII